MDADSKAEILAQAAHLDELIEKSTELILKTDALLNQSRILIREAKRHDSDGSRNHNLDKEHWRR